MIEKTEDRVEKHIRRQAVKFLHGDINYRYKIENIRDLTAPGIHKLLEGFTQDDIDPLEDLFFNTIYPEVDARQERDKSFESMIAMLKAPARLTVIIPSLPIIILKYATIWPTALNVGINAMLAYLTSVRLENILVTEIMALLNESGKAQDENYRLSEEVYREAYRRVPYADGRRMISHAIRVIRSGKDKRMITATQNILSDVQSLMSKSDDHRAAAGQPRIYSEAVQAINFGKDTLKKIEYTFGLFPPDKMIRLVQITKAVELAYLDRVHGKYK